MVARRALLALPDQQSETGIDLWVLPLTSDRKPFPVLQTMFDETEGQFSPDGRWIAYVSNESGRPEVDVQPFPAPGGKWQISTMGGSQVRWRSDGRELYYLAPDGRLMAAAIAFGADAQGPGGSVRRWRSSRLDLATGSNVASKPQMRGVAQRPLPC